MANGQKTANWWIGFGVTVFVALAGWSLFAGASAKQASNDARHEAHLVQGNFDKHIAASEAREKHVVYRLDEMAGALGKLEEKVDQLLKRE